MKTPQPLTADVLAVALNLRGYTVTWLPGDGNDYLYTTSFDADGRVWRRFEATFADGELVEATLWRRIACCLRCQREQARDTFRSGVGDDRRRMLEALSIPVSYLDMAAAKLEAA